MTFPRFPVSAKSPSIESTWVGEETCFALLRADVILITDLPDHLSAAALGSAACASGMTRTKTTQLLTISEADEALGKAVAYRAPGA